MHALTRCRYGTSGEATQRLQNGEKGADEDSEDPHADLILATRQKVSVRALACVYVCAYMRACTCANSLWVA